MANTLYFFQQGLWLAVILSALPLIVATLFGCVISLLQAITQIQDQTLPYAAKLMVVAISLALTGHWIGGELIQLTNSAFNLVATTGR